MRLSIIGGFLLPLLDAAERSQASIEPPSPPRVSNRSPSEAAYAAIFDIGSTGTRLHIHAYGWKPLECFGRGAASIYMPGWNHKVKPGLVNYYNQYKDALTLHDIITSYFEPLHTFFEETLRDEDINGTILMVQATGGFRYLPSEVQTKLLDESFAHLKTWKGVILRHWVRVLSGAEEGAYSWLALNQLARRFFQPFEHVALHPDVIVTNEVKKDSNLPGSVLKDNWKAEAHGTAGRLVKRRVGVVEVGGASAQIALEPAKELRDELLKEMSISALRSERPLLKSHPRGQGFYILNFCHENVVLQIQSLDGFGKQAAFQRFLKFMAVSKKAKAGQDFAVPCLPADARIPVSLSNATDLDISDESHEKRDLGSDVAFATSMIDGDAAACNEAVSNFLLHTWNQPVNMTLAPDYRVYATENFYYYNQYVAKAADSRFSASDFQFKAQDLCGHPKELIRDSIHSDAAQEKVETACFGLTFLSEFIRSIVRIPPDQVIKAVTSVKDLETSYALGALILELPLMQYSMMYARNDEL